MSRIIPINFVWSKELALKASKLYYDYDMKNSSKRYIGWLFIALMQFGIVGALKHDVFGLLYISTFLVLYWYYGRWYLRKRMIEKYYDKHVEDGKEIDFVLNKEGLYVENRVLPWNDIFKVIEFDDGILVQTSESTLFLLNDFFQSFEDRLAFVTLAKEREKVI